VCDMCCLKKCMVERVHSSKKRCGEEVCSVCLYVLLVLCCVCVCVCV